MHDPQSRRRFLSSVTAGAVSLSALAVPVSAGSNTIESCTNITRSGRYKIAGDIEHHGSSGICIRIRANDVTIDGNGHTIEGSRIYNSFGVSIDDVRNVRIEDLAVTDMFTGFNVVGSRVRLEDVIASGNSGSGVLMNPDSERCTVRNSDLSNNDGAGIAAVSSDRHLFSDNTVDDNSRNGILFRQGCSRCTVRRNSASRNEEGGITAWEGGDRNRIFDNVVESNGLDGISINEFNPEPAGDLSIQQNAANGNGRDGIYLRQVDGSRVIRNTARRNGDDGIELDAADENRLIRNVTCENGDEAIAIGPNSADNTLRANKTKC